MADIPDPPIVPPWHPLARDLLPEPRVRCSKCDRRLPVSQTVSNDPRAPWWRICLECRSETDG